MKGELHKLLVRLKCTSQNLPVDKDQERRQGCKQETSAVKSMEGEQEGRERGAKAATIEGAGAACIDPSTQEAKASGSL